MGTITAQTIGKTDFDFFPEPMARGFFVDEQAVIQSGRPLIGREELVLDKVTGTTRQISTTGSDPQFWRKLSLTRQHPQSAHRYT